MSENKIRVGLIGLGRAGVQMHLSELDRFADEFKLAAGCDILAERRQLFLERYPDAKVYENDEDLLKDPNVELVSIAAPSRLHVQMTRRALAEGKLVFLEKPFALSKEGLNELKRLDQAYPGKLYLRHNRRFEACYNHILDVMRSGILGNVFEIRLRRQRQRFRDDWQTVLSEGGGQLNNWAPHLIDQALHLLESDVESIWSDLKRIHARGDAEDHIKLIFRGKNGRIVDVQISDAVALPEPVASVCGDRGVLVSEEERTLHLKYLPQNFRLPPQGARLEAPPLSGPNVYSLIPEPQWIEEEIPVKPANGYDMGAIYHYLYLAIREGQPFPVKNEEGFRTMETIRAIRAQHPAFQPAGDLL